MNCSELRQEYENLFRIEKFTDPDKYLWEMSNSRYIMWLEDRIKYNLPPNKVYCLYYRDIFNIVDAPVLKVYKTKAGAYRAMRRLLNSIYTRWYDERIIKGKNRYGNHPIFEGSWKISEEDVRP